MERSPIGIGGWLPNDEALLVYDEYDIWQIDVSGRKKAINITNSYGRKRHIKFRLVNEGKLTVISSNKRLLLEAFDSTTKENGFYEILCDEVKDPEILTMKSSFVYSVSSDYLSSDLIFKPIKAKSRNTWIVMMQSARDAPNLFLTKDFINFIRLTDVQPHAQYNWLSSELVTWKKLDGTFAQGVLYKPENFNTNRKYPLIFNYYEKQSDRAYVYPGTSFFNTPSIDCPSWFVSRGYLVFVPDITYEIGETGESVLNSVISAAEYLSKFLWVDSSKMAICGTSFGGYETNYIVTHSNIFSAAASGAGISNLISHYNGLFPRL